MPSSANGSAHHRPERPYAGPQDAHLEAQHRARDRTDGEEDRGDLPPPLGQQEGGRVVVPEAAPMGD